MSIQERIKFIIESLFRGNKAAFSKQINVSPTVIENVVGTRNGKPSYDVIEKICANANISAEWLLTGNGEILKKNEVVEQKNESGNEILFTLIEKNEKLNQEIGALRNENQNLRGQLEEYELNRKKTIDMGVENQKII
ncbi:MAG: XRE family transcriptional regulator [Bacteroidales bacterium]|jgi:transcriptional regulator with XRE-family HTH domain|nr:XRE family transcriptional regulator [Bacteroidales bacterium]